MTELSFKGHTVVVTGAGGGLGRTYVSFLTLHMNVYAITRSEFPVIRCTMLHAVPM